MTTDAGARAPRIDEVPTAPRRPSPWAKRLVLGYGGGQGIVLLVGWGFLTIGLFLAVVFSWGAPIDVAIAISPAEVTGTVVAAKRNWNATFDGAHPSTVRYEYVVSGARYQGGYDALILPPAGGDPIEIEYSEVLPGWSRIAGTRRGWFPWYVVAFVVAFPVFGAVLIARVTIANRREIRAFTLGRPTLARVTFRGLDESKEFNGRNPCMVRWEFKGPGGEVFEGSLTSMRLLELEPLVAAEQVVVLYDPDDPRRNTLYVP